MGRIIVIASQKGGVGKTTTALNLGYSLSRFGGPVMVLDCDPQGGIAIASNLRKRTEKGLIDLLKKQCGIEDVIMNTREKAFSIAGIGNPEPGDVFLFEKAAEDGRLGEILRTMAGNFSYMIVDSPAGLGGIVSALLASGDSVIAVTSASALSLKSLPSFLKLVGWIRAGENPALRLDGILFTMLTEGRENQVLDEIRSTLPSGGLFSKVISYDEIFEQASMKSVPVALMSDGQEAARSYMELALELKERELNSAAAGGVDNEIEGLF